MHAHCKLFAYWVILHAILSAADFFLFFKINFFFQEYIYHQSVEQLGSKSGPTVWVQTVCKGYQ